MVFVQFYWYKIGFVFFLSMYYEIVITSFS